MFNLKEIINLSVITGDKVAVGVSGGADSLALVLLLDDLLRPLGRRVIALTVNHGLRKESLTEAEYVAKLMAEHCIEHHILTWDGVKPQSGVEEAARLARYALLRSWCQKNDVETLCVAHHLLDQAETFLIRLQRGSGLTGLCGMSEVSELEGLKIVRPLLKVVPEALKEYLRLRNVKWVEDPSNQSEDFLRCRMRKFIPILEERTGITSKRITDTMQVLARSKDYICKQTEKFIGTHATYWENAGVSLPVKILREAHEEIIHQVLRRLIQQIGKNIYTSRAVDIEALAERLNNENFRGATLGHCEVFVSKGQIWIVPELKLTSRLPRQIWADFVQLYPGYAKLDLPYKLRVALVKNKMPIEF